MDGAFLTNNDLAPILRGSWRGTRSAFACLAHQARVVGVAVCAVHRQSGGRRCPGYPDLRDLEHETLVTLMERARERAGLPLPRDWISGQNMAPWLFRVVQNQARDIVRREIAMKRAGAAVHLPIEEVYSLGAEGGQGDVTSHLDSERLYALVDRHIESGSPPTHALAWVLLRHPSKLRRELVERAALPDPRGHQDTVHGLAREPGESWELLMDWARHHAADPSGSASRRELAWILRSTDLQSPEAWRAGAPDEAKTARDTLRQWENRFRKRLKAAKEEEEE